MQLAMQFVRQINSFGDNVLRRVNPTRLVGMPPRSNLRPIPPDFAGSSYGYGDNVLHQAKAPCAFTLGLERLMAYQEAFAAYPHSLWSLRYSTFLLIYHAFALLPPCGEGKEVIRTTSSLRQSALYRKRRYRTAALLKKVIRWLRRGCCRSPQNLSALRNMSLFCLPLYWYTGIMVLIR